jgi:hypothetical protein
MLGKIVERHPLEVINMGDKEIFRVSRDGGRNEVQREETDNGGEGKKTAHFFLLVYEENPVCCPTN